MKFFKRFSVSTILIFTSSILIACGKTNTPPDSSSPTSDSGKPAVTYYEEYKVSISGAEKSNADKLMTEIKDNHEGHSESLKNQKFFLFFISKTCGACVSAHEAIEYLHDDGKELMKDEKLTLKTIFTDDEVESDKEDWKKAGTIGSDDSASTQFEAFLIRNALMIDLFANVAQSSYLFQNNKITEDEILELAVSPSDPSKFKLPTIILLDFTENGAGIKEVFIYNEFLLGGSSKLDKGQYLADAWFSTGFFGPMNNQDLLLNTLE